METQSRRVAIVDVEVDAAQAFRSMLEVLNGRTRCRWQLVDTIDQANVVVTAGAARAAQYEPGERPVVAIVEPSESRPRTRFVLVHPFRVMQVLSLLDEIADAAPAAPAQRAPAPEAAQGPASPWDFAESVRALRGVAARARCYEARGGGARVLVAGDLSHYAADATLCERLRAGRVQLGALQPAPDAAPAAQRRPIAELLWHNAVHADAALAPWLDHGASFRLKRWPDFGAVPVTRETLQVVATLAAASHTRAELARAVAAARDAIDPILNALSSCDALMVFERAERRGAAPAHPLGLLRAVFGGLRRRLGGGA